MKQTPQETRSAEAKRADEARQALAMRKSGASYEEISRSLTKKLGYSISTPTAWRRVQSALKAIVKLSAKDAEKVKVLELARYDFYLRNLDPGIRMGDPRAINTALGISKRRAELLGLDAPEVVKIDIPALLLKAKAGGEDGEEAAQELRDRHRELKGGKG